MKRNKKEERTRERNGDRDRESGKDIRKKMIVN